MLRYGICSPKDIDVFCQQDEDLSNERHRGDALPTSRLAADHRNPLSPLIRKNIEFWVSR
jgi:hypothetical protein